MIDLYSSQIIDILPESIANEPEVQALSYALNKAIKRVLNYRDNLKIFSNISEATNEVLDMLGVEINSLYYDSKASIEEKRELIKRSLVWYEKAGTSSAVRESIEIVYGFGEVQEWYKYDGEPFHFKVVVSSQGEGIDIEVLRKMISRVKNASSYLDTIEVVTPANAKVYVGMTVRSWSKSAIKMEG